MTPLDWALKQELRPASRYLLLIPGHQARLTVAPGTYYLWTNSNFLVAVEEHHIPAGLKKEFQGVAEGERNVLTLPLAFLNLLTKSGARKMRRLTIYTNGAKAGFVLAPEWFVTPREAGMLAVKALKNLRRVAQSAMFYPDERWAELAGLLDKIIPAEQAVKVLATKGWFTQTLGGGDGDS